MRTECGTRSGCCPPMVTPVLAWRRVSEGESLEEVRSPSVLSSSPSNPLLENVQRKASNLLISCISKKSKCIVYPPGKRAWPALGSSANLERGGTGCRAPHPPSLPIQSPFLTVPAAPASARLQGGWEQLRLCVPGPAGSALLGRPRCTGCWWPV